MLERRDLRISLTKYIILKKENMNRSQ